MRPSARLAVRSRRPSAPRGADIRSRPNEGASQPFPFFKSHLSSPQHQEVWRVKYYLAAAIEIIELKADGLRLIPKLKRVVRLVIFVGSGKLNSTFTLAR